MDDVARNFFFFRRQLQHCPNSMQILIFINNIILIFLSTGTGNISK